MHLATVLPLHHRAFDDARLGLHQGAGGIVVGDSCLGLRVQLSPCGPLPIDQFLPACCRHPVGQAVGGHPLFLEVVKLVVHAVFSQPDAGFLDGVAVGYAVNGDE